MSLDAAEEALFSTYLAETERRRVVIALGLAPSLYVFFGLLDWIVFPGRLLTLATVRGAAALVMAGAFVALLRTHTYWAQVLSAATSFTVACVGIAAMCTLTGGHASPYYAGLCVCLVFAAVLVTWPVWFSILDFGFVLLCYYVPILFEPSVDWRVLAMHSFFLLSTAAVAVLGNHIRRQLALGEFRARQRLARSNRELQELQQARDHMFQHVSHELRTPLTLILTPVESLLDAPLADTLRGALQGMRRNTLRLLKLVEDLLDLARLDHASLPSTPRATDVGALLHRLADDVRPMAEARGLRLATHLPPGQVVYEVDAVHLERVVLNLLSNAMKFTPAGGQLEITLGDTETGMVIGVADTGEGIAPESQKRIFERFGQAEAGSQRRQGGTGLGLTIVSELTRIMGGTVGLESWPGRGSRFTLCFPRGLRRPAGEAEVPAVPTDLRAVYASIEPEGEALVPRRAGARGPHVLLAEDDAALAAQLVDLLSPRYRVTTVPDGEEALAEALESIPDVVITDVMMPRMDGLQLCEALRSRPALRNTPVVVLSARGELDDRVRARRVGADTCLTKPFHPRELLATIEGLLRARMRIVGSFVLGRPLGRGGQGRVHLGEHLETGERVALKIIDAGDLDDESARRRLRREHQALTRLRHPNVVRVVEEGEVEPGFYLALEYISGVTFKRIVDEVGPLHCGHASALAVGLCAALQAVHDEGLLHRDVKCSNAMVVRGGEPLRERVRLIDFGIVTFGQTTDSQSRGVFGTPAYLSPEILGGGTPSVASDVYAVGVVLFYLSTGRLPYDGDDPRTVYRRVIEGAPPSPSSLRPDIPAALEATILRAMARHPAQRYPGVAALAEALADIPDAPVPLSIPEDGEEEEADSFGSGPHTATVAPPAPGENGG